jgi:hypothetical protein
MRNIVRRLDSKNQVAIQNTFFAGLVFVGIWKQIPISTIRFARPYKIAKSILLGD